MSKIVAITQKVTRREVQTDDGITHRVDQDDFGDVPLGCGEDYPFTDDADHNATGVAP